MLKLTKNYVTVTTINNYELHKQAKSIVHFPIKFQNYCRISHSNNLTISPQFKGKGEIPHLNALKEGITKTENENPRDRLNFEERKIDVNGIHLNIFEDGEGTHNLLFLPGYLGTFATDFGKLFKVMDRSKFRYISWDPPGYGKSRPPKRQFQEDYFLEDAQLVAQLMENLGYNKYSVLGWSNGGVTACALAAEFPQRITKLILSCSTASFNEDDVQTNLRFCDASTWSEPSLKAMLKMYGKEYFEYVQSNYREFIQYYYNSGLTQRFKERISLIKCPTLVFYGLKDPFIHVNHALYYEEHIKNCKLRPFLEGKHNLHLTHTEEFVTEVEKFLCR